MLLFLVPDEPDDDAVESEESSKAQLDDGGPTSKAMRKVDLDLDDAPFLEDEEEEEEEEEDFETEALEEPEEKKGPPAWLKNKLVWVAAVVILVLLGVIVKLLFFTAPPPAQPPEEPAVPEMDPEAPSTPDATALSDEDLERIAMRVLELAADRLERIAWEVIPDMAEVVVRERIRELEAEAEEDAKA